MMGLLTQSTWVHRIGWVLVHSLWQFALVALLAVVLRRALQRFSGSVRYVALLTAMSLIVIAPVVTWFFPWSSDAPAMATGSGRAQTAERISPSQDGVDPMAREPRRASSSVAPATLRHASPFRSGRATDVLFSWWSTVKTHVQPWLSQIVLVWLAGVMVAAVRPMLGWYMVHRLRRVGVSSVADVVQGVLQRTATRLRLARAVEVLESTLVHTPVVLGYFRPVILLPMCLLTDLPVAQLESILAHELAHVRRHDYLANLLQTLVETLFFYHPAVWWLSRQIRNERENCCDDVAMAAVGSRADYGRALLAIEELRGGPAKFSLSARGGSLLARIRRVAGCEPAPPVIVSGSVLGVVLVSIVTVGAATWGAAPAAENVQDALSPTKAGDAATSPAPTASQDPFAPPGKTVEKAKKRYAVARTMRIRVVGPDDKPVAGTHVMVRATMKGKRWDEVLEDYTCDADGKAVIELPQGVTALHLELWKKGYFRHLADREETQPAGSRPLPEDITIKLTKPTPAQVEAVAALENTRRDTIRVEESDKGRRVIIELTWHTGLRLLHLLPDPDELLVVAPNMTDADLANLEGLRGLKALSLVGDKITDAGLAHLEGLRGLKELQLICPEITDAGLAHLQPLHALEKLTLACSVTDAGMKHLTPLKELRTLIARRIESDPATHEVFHALVQLTNVEGLEERLDNVCDYLGDYHRIKVRFDEVALGSAKIDGRIPVTINVKNVPLVATLGLLLRPHGLDWTVGKGTLLITTRDIGPRGTPGTAALQQALPSLKQVYVDW